MADELQGNGLDNSDDADFTADAGNEEELQETVSEGDSGQGSDDAVVGDAGGAEEEEEEPSEEEAV